MSPARLRLLCLLALGPACNGGPISDFPHGSTGEDTGGDADGPGDGTSRDGSDEGEVGDGASEGDPDGPPSAADGGVAGPPLDGGAPDAGDGGPAACSFASEATGDGCYGIYCATSLDALTAASGVGACSGELALVCGGDLAQAVATCSASHAREADFAAAVTACARAASTLTAASDGCLGCYVAEAQCALDQCLEACLGGLPGACDTCRLERCGEAFATCSGVPAPG